ncbi:MAG: aromatic ring hydroxylase [Candidatus Diapherotrites archaeon CG08_land_8_20_14_0_20_34_12]|nr:MAG: aromatic ring hydroxylase [Candidatus Diapherotrites archaeon CG08_land_8_20_14_0_20_34_12]
MVDEKSVLDSLKNVYDPELGISIVDLGFIYKIDIINEKVTVRMTFTSPHCPLSGMITDQVKEAVMKVDGVKEVNIELVFDPPWNPSMMNAEIRKQLGV